jgi:hypothetical protein
MDEIISKADPHPALRVRLSVRERIEVRVLVKYQEED